MCWDMLFFFVFRLCLLLHAYGLRHIIPILISSPKKIQPLGLLFLSGLVVRAVTLHKSLIRFPSCILAGFKGAQKKQRK
ncbi:hypothetical protein BDV28DRAFT_52712 [Aspergillus coremiiformis]|uniref:Uncharacterized protein n=1 Tax=Aspergillus coremiiformis TaxID=138285 RepID=A0A5N6YWQ8_9EURO|nr:hypothetical protein BDV28DRAFT_52712 [Aspergillus coremiiformis]